MAINSINGSPKTRNQGSPRRLFEILEEEQEPFVLEFYLLERGCRGKKLELDLSHIGCFFTTQNNKISSINLKSSSGRKSSGQFLSIAKSIYSKIIFVNGVLKPKHGSDKKKGRRKDKEVMEAGRCSDATCSTLSKSDTDEESISSPANYKTNLELPPERVMGQWRLTEENKQFSPDSVLDEIDLLQSIPVYNNVRQNQEASTTATRIRSPKKVSEDSIPSLWEMLEQTRQEKPNKFGNKSFTKYMNSMKALQQTKQLLFDCVREVVETENSSKQQRIIKREKGLMSPEDIGRIMCSNLKIWGKHSGNGKSAKKLLSTDILKSAGHEWGGCEELEGEIVTEIGNGLFGEILDEIVREMIDQC